MKIKRKVEKIFYIIFFIFVVFCFSKVYAASQYDVVFSEVMWPGSSTSSSDEWIELYNNSSQNIDLSGWQITKFGDDGEDLMLTIPSGIIPAKGYFLISNNNKDYKFTNGESILNIEPDYINSDVSLSNSKLQLKLYDSNWNDRRALIDMAGNSGNPTNFAGSNSTPKASMGRINITSDGTIKTNWITSNTQKNLDLDISDLATPQNSGKLTIEYFQADKNQIDKAKNETITFSVKISDGSNNIQSSNLDLSQIRAGLSNMEMQNNSNRVYTYTLVANIDDNCGSYIIPVVVTGKTGLTTESSVTVNIIQTSQDIQVNEILPKPDEGTDKEYIELYNQGNENVDLYQWQLDDKANFGSNPYTINDRVIIKAKDFQIFYKTETNLSLNDSGDYVRVILPNGIETQAIEYSKANKGESYNYTEYGWKWSITLTPNQPNTITAPISISKTSSKKTKTENNRDPPQIFISDLKNYQPETYVIISGIVIAAPNFLATTYFYIQDDSGGIQIYCYNKDFPDLKNGDKIQVTGRVSSTSERRIKIDSANDIIIIEQNYFVQPQRFFQKPNYLDFEGMLVEIMGIVTETSGDTFYLEDEWGENVKIYIKKSTNIDKPRMYKGDYVKIIGIVDLTKNGFQILPVLQSHVEILDSSKTKAENKSNNNLLISTAHATNDDQVLGLNKKNRYLQDLNRQNINNNLENIIKIIITLCGLFLVYIAGEFLWKKHIQQKT